VSPEDDPAYPHSGDSTAVPLNLKYRLGKLKAMDLLSGVWLDCGCANGGYTEALIDYGAERATGIDPDPNRIAEAKGCQIHADKTEYYILIDRFPFPDESFDGVLLDEVLEHVDDETATLREIRRVVRPIRPRKGECSGLTGTSRRLSRERHQTMI
jgi:SAM-dependent methyltransferase